MIGWFYTSWVVRIALGRLTLRSQSWNLFTSEWSLKRKGERARYNGVQTVNELWVRVGWFAFSYWWF